MTTVDCIAPHNESQITDELGDINQSSQQVSSSFSFFDFRGDGVNHGILDPETFIGRFIIFQLEIGVLAQVCFSYLFL